MKQQPTGLFVFLLGSLSRSHLLLLALDDNVRVLAAMTLQQLHEQVSGLHQITQVCSTMTK